MLGGGDGGWRVVTMSFSFLRLLSCLLLNSFDRTLLRSDGIGSGQQLNRTERRIQRWWVAEMVGGGL